MRHVYDELAKKKLAPGSPFQNCFDAFEPHNRSSLAEQVEGVWKVWSINFAERPGLPGDDALFDSAHPKRRRSQFDYLLYLLDWMVDHATHAPRVANQPADFDIPDWARVLLEPLGIVTGDVFRSIEGLLRLTRKFTAWIGEDFARHTDLHFRLLYHLLSAIHAELGKGLADEMNRSDDVRHAILFLDYGLAVTKGLVADDVVRQGFDVIEQYDVSGWLTRHGCKYPSLAHGDRAIRFLFRLPAWRSLQA